MKVNAWVAAGAASAVFAAGAASTYLWRPQPVSGPAPAAAAAGHAAAAGPDGGSSPSNGAITIAPELIARAGIVTEVVGTTGAAASWRLPGTVQPNAYRKVSVTPLVGGRVTRVVVELGQAVSRGALLAEVYTPEVAQVRAAYLAAQADMEAGAARLHRTERLVALGSASQQELDETRAEHVRHENLGREAAARLRLFGLDPERIGDASPQAETTASFIRVIAPQSGVVIDRPVTPGMTVEPSTPMVTLADLSPVWVMAEVYERDLARVVTGAVATITSEAYPDLQLTGRVTYLAPEVRADTRTTQVRIEVPNPDGRLRFGMYVTVVLGRTGPLHLEIPGSAVQTVGPDAVVFVPDGSSGNAFRERRVTIGAVNGTRVAIATGLTPGERIVTQGSFMLRAEAERLGIRAGDQSGTIAPPAAEVQTVTVEVTEKGFTVSTAAITAGVPVRMTFVRRTKATCATDLAIPDYGIKRELPLDTPVTVEFTPRTNVTYQCGMGMLSGTLTVR